MLISISFPEFLDVMMLPMNLSNHHMITPRKSTEPTHFNHRNQIMRVFPVRKLRDYKISS